MSHIYRMMIMGGFLFLGAFICLVRAIGRGSGSQELQRLQIMGLSYALMIWIIIGILEIRRFNKLEGKMVTKAIETSQVAIQSTNPPAPFNISFKILENIKYLKEKNK